MECVAEFPENLAKFVTAPVEQTNVWHRDYVYAKGGSCIHAIWTYPLHGIISLVTAPLMPLVALVNLIAAGIFGLIACCAQKKEDDEEQIDWREASANALSISWQCLTFTYFFVGRAFCPFLARG